MVYRTYLTRDGMISLGPYAERFSPGTVIEIVPTRAGTFILVESTEPAALDLVARRLVVLEDLMDRISAEPEDEVRLYGAHYLRKLRGLAPQYPRRAAYNISQADAKRVSGYVEQMWSNINARKD